MRNRYGFNSFKKFILISCLPWRISENHLIEDNSKRPDIAFGGVLHSFQNLRCHVDRTANTWFEHLGTKVINILGKTKVTNLINSFIYQDICWFQISMHNLLSNKLCKTSQYLSHDVKNLFLLKFLAFHKLLKITVFTELSDDVETILRA